MSGFGGPSEMILGVHHIGLTVEEPHDLGWLDHVCDQLGDVWRTGPNVRLRLSRSDIARPSSRLPRPVNLAGIAHICLQSRDIHDGLALGQKRGLTPISQPVDLGTDFRYLYAHTPQGVLLELEGAPFVEDVAPAFWIGHVAFVARDIVALVEFYGRVLGLTPSPVSRLGRNVLFDRVTGLDNVDLSAMWLSGFNLGLEFWQYHHPAVLVETPVPASGFTSICFQTNDFEHDCLHVVAQGSIKASGADFGLRQTKTAGFIDPEGNRFDLIAFDDPCDPNSNYGLAHIDILERVTAQRPGHAKA
jgi:catechol 2,3-dioxygenase-like lactoylglutathione lyase family enzyme